MSWFFENLVSKVRFFPNLGLNGQKSGLKGQSFSKIRPQGSWFFKLGLKGEFFFRN